MSEFIKPGYSPKAHTAKTDAVGKDGGKKASHNVDVSFSKEQPVPAASAQIDPDALLKQMGIMSKSKVEIAHPRFEAMMANFPAPHEFDQQLKDMVNYTSQTVGGKISKANVERIALEALTDRLCGTPVINA